MKLQPLSMEIMDNIASWNVKGLNSQNKQKDIFYPFVEEIILDWLDDWKLV